MMHQVTKMEIERRLNLSAAQLVERVPRTPVPPEELLRVADANDLPIGTTDIDRDPVARAIFLKAYVEEARDAISKSVDAVWNVFAHGSKALA